MVRLLSLIVAALVLVCMMAVLMLKLTEYTINNTVCVKDGKNTHCHIEPVEELVR